MKKPKRIFFIGFAGLAFLSGCESWSDYQHNEVSMTDRDLHKTGKDSYGGTEAPYGHGANTRPYPSAAPFVSPTTNQ